MNPFNVHVNFVRIRTRSDRLAVQYNLRDYDVIKCINYIRSQVRGGSNPVALLEANPKVFLDDEFLRPVLQEDGLLAHDFCTEETYDLGCYKMSRPFARTVQPVF
jgi:hypothetical protein